MLIRHGETHWNREQRIQGQQNSELSAEGLAQAQAAAACLAVETADALVSSDLGRTLQTATPIAAAMAGAKSVLAADVDPLSVAAIRLNAAKNGVELAVSADDPLGAVPNADVIVIGDLVYEPELATRVAGFLEAASRLGALVLFGDRTTAKRPPRRHNAPGVNARRSSAS